jgi:hypothetical protein
MKTGSPKAKWFGRLLKNPKSLSLPRKRESRKAWKDWIPRIKCGAGLLEFIPMEIGAGMTTWK